MDQQTPETRRELDEMSARRTAITAERATLGEGDADQKRIWAIEGELDNMNERLTQLGVSFAHFA